MGFHMLGMIFEQLKVFYPIIGFIMVNMMNHLGWFQVSTNTLFHDISMLSYVTIQIGVWVVFFKYMDITTNNPFTSTPMRGFFTNLIKTDVFSITWLRAYNAIFSVVFKTNLTDSALVFKSWFPRFGFLSNSFFKGYRHTFFRAINTFCMGIINTKNGIAVFTRYFFHRLIIPKGDPLCQCSIF